MTVNMAHSKFSYTFSLLSSDPRRSDSTFRASVTLETYVDTIKKTVEHNGPALLAEELTST